MGKRYAYYRKPDGRPYRGPNTKYAPNAILSELGQTAFLNADGKVSWQGLDVPLRLKVALRSAIAILDPDDREVTGEDAWGIVWKAVLGLIKSAPGKSVGAEALIRAIDNATAAFFRAPLEAYTLVSSLSIASLPARQIKVKDCITTAIKKRGTRFPFPQALSKPARESAFTGHIKNTRYAVVKVNVCGRTIHDAAGRALNSLHLLRALWSLNAIYDTWRLFSAKPSRKPLGTIHIGPIHTLHRPDGRLATDWFWYEPNYAGDLPILANGKQWVRMEKYRQWAMARLRHLRYMSDLESLLIRYIHALDESDMDIAFLQIWSILERITGTVGAGYDETIKKAVWILSEEEQPLARDILELLRCRRNQYVHSGKALDADEQAAYLIKSFIDPHLHLLLSGAFGVCSLDEYAEYLSLPTSRKVLSKRKQMLTKAMGYHTRRVGE